MALHAMEASLKAIRDAGLDPRQIDGVIPIGIVSGTAEDFIDNFELGLYDKVLAEGGKLPSEAMRLKLARREMPAELLGRREGLMRKQATV